MSRNETTYLIETPEGDKLSARFKWTVSRGRDTYGYNICSLWINGSKVVSCNGGGYDMQGKCLADWLLAYETGRNHNRRTIKDLACNRGSGDDDKGFYGLSFYTKEPEYKPLKTWQEGCKISLDGACGFESIRAIMEELGYKLTYLR